uniref:Uncharacterized protein n=1 Tax=Oryza barthii TaxID=65489 RepID=A0A0D3GYK4_9ORYZ
MPGHGFGARRGACDARGGRACDRRGARPGFGGSVQERNAAWHGSTRRGARNEEERRGTTRWLGGLVRQPCPTRHFAEHVAGGVSACWRRQGRRGSRLGCKREGELERE